MDKRNLEGKLKAIQELKSEKYIGTQEAWRYIQRVAALYDNPQRIANAINKEVSKQGTLYYPATPELIIGISSFYGNASELYSLERYAENNGELDEEGSLDDEEDLINPLNNFTELLTGDRYQKPQPAKLGRYFLQIFQDIQSPKACNEHFVACIINKLMKDAPMSEYKKSRIFLKTFSTNWDYQLSLENLRDWEKRTKRQIFTEEIELIRRIERMTNDRVDDRLENRREILVDYIDNQQDQDLLKRMGLGYEVNYDSLVGKLKSKLTRITKTLRRFEELDAPDNNLKQQKRLIDLEKFLLKIFEPERNFVNRYLSL